MGRIGSSREFAAVRDDWRQGKPRSVITNRNEVEHIVLGTQDLAVLLNGEDTAGQMAIFELVAQPGASAGPHHQTSENEYWYVVEGEWEIQTGDRIETVGPGSMVLTPEMATHAFKLLGDTPGKMLIINAPAGHELFFKDIQEQVKAETPQNEIHNSLGRFDVIFE